MGGLRGRVAGLEISGVEKICGFGAILRVVSGPENLGGVGNPGWARDAPSYTHVMGTLKECSSVVDVTRGPFRKE